MLHVFLLGVNSMTKSRVLKKLRSGDFVKVAGISRVADPWLTQVVGQIGYDVVWFDLEHRSFSADTVYGQSLACRATGIDLMVRTRKRRLLQSDAGTRIRRKWTDDPPHSQRR